MQPLRRRWDCIKAGGSTLLLVVEEFVVGTSAATRGRAFRADCRGRRNEPGGGGGHPLQTSASVGVFPSSRSPSDSLQIRPERWIS
jgi:hypothetical protein